LQSPNFYHTKGYPGASPSPDVDGGRGPVSHQGSGGKLAVKRKLRGNQSQFAANYNSISPQGDSSRRAFGNFSIGNETYSGAKFPPIGGPKGKKHD